MFFPTGLIPVYTSQQLLGNTGDFLMFTFTMVAVMTSASGEVLAAASIIVYDIYQTYISPFQPTAAADNMTIRRQKQVSTALPLLFDFKILLKSYSCGWLI